MRLSARSHDALESTGRTEALSTCLQAAKDFFAAYVNIPLDDLDFIHFVTMAHMAFALITSCRILILNDSDWRVRLARQTFDFAAASQFLDNRFKHPLPCFVIAREVMYSLRARTLY